VRVIAQFVGGGFGSKGAVWSHVALAAMAAKQARLPVRLSVTRQQMFAFVGFRPRTIQKVELGATSAGALTVIRHEGFTQTSRFDDFVEPFTAPTQILYACPNVSTNRAVVRLDTSTPTFMRAPGHATGTFALECAMDELAYALRMDPLELRLLNHADADPDTGRPWSSKSLKECYRRGAERFGWARRSREPGKTRDADGRTLIGLGMATAVYPAHRAPASASARVLPDGTAVVRAGSQDIGPGTSTSMTQVAADALGLAPERVRFELGDTTMPPTPVSAASQTMASTGSAVHEACLAVRRRLVQMAIADAASPLHGLAEKDVVVADGRLSSKHSKSRGETIAALLGRSGLPHVEEQVEAKPGAEDARFSMWSFGAQFCEVRVDPDLGTARVSRWVGAFAAGRAINPRMVRSQLHGGIVFGIGMALLERSAMDARYGRFVTRDLAEYHVPVNADVPEIEVIYVDERDEHVNPLGAKGVGELGNTGAAAAIANAVFHATGKRVRDLPITLDKLL
jgi:xanthine dehydrogenase YagR molybdenum-binding subunit